MNQRKFSKREVLAAIRGSGGIVTAIAAKLECHRSTAKKKIDLWEDTRTLYNDERQKVGDLVEQKILGYIKEGEPWALRFYANNQMKDRGYGLNQIGLSADSGSSRMAVNIVFSDDEPTEI